MQVTCKRDWNLQLGSGFNLKKSKSRSCLEFQHRQRCAPCPSGDSFQSHGLPSWLPCLMNVRADRKVGATVHRTSRPQLSSRSTANLYTSRDVLKRRGSNGSSNTLLGRSSQQTTSDLECWTTSTICRCYHDFSIPIRQRLSFVSVSPCCCIPLLVIR